MKICIVGAGSMGSVYATFFAEAGHEVWCVDVWQDHIDAINRDGLRLSGFSGDRTVAMSASTNVDTAGECDLYIVATKADGVAAAAAAIAPHLGSTTPLITIQNGLGAAERIAEHVPSANVILGVAQGFGASLQGPGHAHHNGMQLIRLGEMAGGITDRLLEVERLWNSSGFDVKAFEDIDQLIWEKFVVNVALGGPCIVFGCTVGELMGNEERRAVAMGCATEAHTVGRALGVTISYDDPVAYVDAFAARMPDAKPSMLQDHEAGRRCELDAINGQVPVQGRKAGVATPYNDTVCAVIRRLEEQW